MGIHGREFDADDRGPLDGLRVLDMSRLVAGNMLTLQLGDFGAEVVSGNRQLAERQWIGVRN